MAKGLLGSLLVATIDHDVVVFFLWKERKTGQKSWMPAGQKSPREGSKAASVLSPFALTETEVQPHLEFC